MVELIICICVRGIIKKKTGKKRSGWPLGGGGGGSPPSSRTASILWKFWPILSFFPVFFVDAFPNTQIGQIPFKCFSKPFCVIKRNPWKRGKLEVPTFIIFWGLLQIGSASSLPLWWFIITLRVDGLAGRCLHSHGHKPDQTAGVVYCSYSLILGNW